MKINFKFPAALMMLSFCTVAQTSFAQGYSIDSKIRLLLQETEKQGLIIQKYTNEEARLNQLLAAGLTADAEKLASSLALKISSDLVAGQVRAANFTTRRSIVIDKKLQKPQTDWVNAYLSGSVSVEQLVQTLAPKNEYYQNLVQTFQRLKSMIDSGAVPAAPSPLATIKPKATDRNSILYARARLALLGYQNDTTNSAMSQDLIDSIIEFQANHKLVADGIAGPATWKVLAQDPAAILTKYRLNIDRARWLPDSLGPNHVYVNTAEQKLKLILNSQLTMEFKTIAGRTDRQTPILFDSMSHLILNPTWTVPQSILLKDKAPQFALNPGRVYELNMQVIDDVTNLEVDPYSVDWLRLSPTYSPYTLVQRPGRLNALGFVKFPLTNPYAIYLHDTDSRQLFEKSERQLSSGCVRLEKPFEFAEQLLASQQWTADSLRMASEYLYPEATAPSRVKFGRSIPVYLFYLTTTSDANGKLILLNDNYGLDSEAYALLSQMAGR